MPTRKVTSSGDEIIPHKVVTKDTSEDTTEDEVTEEAPAALGAEGFYLVNHRTVSE